MARYITASRETDITPVSSDTYTAPLKKTVRNIKFFSLSSLAVSTLISPVFFIIESEVDMAVRAVMVGIALATSALSTGLIQWVLKPYCMSGQVLAGKVKLNRMTWLGRSRSTIIDPATLRVEKNGRMFSNLTTLDGKDQFYVHETTKFWRHIQKDIARPLDGPS